MAESSVTLSDFSGGLVTSIEPSRLKAHQSPDLLNVDVLDSHAIRMRNGYHRVNATPFSAMPVKSLHRYYSPGGGKYWVALAGTTVYSSQDSVLTTHGFAQSEELAHTGGTTYTLASHSGGSSLMLTGTQNLSMSVPYSTSIKARVFGPYSYKVDNGSWIAGTAQTLSISGLSATSHTLQFTPAARNSTGIRVFSGATGNSAEVERDLPTMTGGTYYLDVEWYDYHDGHAGDISIGLTDNTSYLYAGVYWSQNTGRYLCKATGAGGAGVTDYTSSSILRSAAWHTARFEITYDPSRWADHPYWARLVSIDDVAQSSMSSYAFDTKPHFRASAYSRNSAGIYTWIDGLFLDGALFSDGGSSEYSASWTMTHTGTGTASVLARGSTPSAKFYADTVEYSASPAWNRIAGVSASAESLAGTSFNSRFYFATPYNAMRKYNGTAASALTATAPAAGFVTVKQRRLFTGGKASDPSLVEYTNIDTDSFVASGAGALKPAGKDTGNDCTGMIVWNDVIWWLTYSRLHALKVQGDATSWANDAVTSELSQQFGCIAPKSLVTAPNAIIFLSEGAVRAYGQIPTIGGDGTGFIELSQNIRPDIEAINQSYVHKVCAAFYGNRYYLSVPTGTSTVNDTTYVYRMADGKVPGSWTKWDYGVSCFCVPRADDGGLYGGSTTDGTLFRIDDGGNDDGEAISMLYVTPPISTQKGYAVTNHFRRAHIGARSGATNTLTVTPYNSDVPGAPTTVTMDSTTDAQPIRIPMPARGKSLGLRFTTTGSDQTLAITEATLTYLSRMR